MQFPEEFLIKILDNLSANKEKTHLSYVKLKALINIYNTCPARLKGDSNNSDAFKRSVEHLKNMSHISKDKTEKIVRRIHMRLEEKFKDYR